VIAKPTVADLGVDPDTQHWQRSGAGPGTIEIAFVQAPAPGAATGPGSAPSPAIPAAETPPATPATPASEAPTAAPASAVTSATLDPGDAPASSVPHGTEDWVLMRLNGDADGRVLVFDRHEWECFLDGARNGEFDDAVGPAAP
jgi:hypothetical protein